MTKNFRQYLSNSLEETITNVTPISGGDISSAYKIYTSNNIYFLKHNNALNALTMFRKEVRGLQTIAKTETIKTPKVLNCDSYENSAFLLLEFIESKSASTEDFKKLGDQLAKLHQHTSESFGFLQDNFIGLLPQSNAQHYSWVDFYTQERLIPQLELAKQKGFLQNSECPNIKHIKNKLYPIFENVMPALLHGDLWSGNYLISKDGIPYLIDPAVYYGHHEVDIAMSKLFSGFGDAFYGSYFSHFPNEDNTSKRVDIYQLYYLLVHLNMFGSYYYSSVISILIKYF